MSTGIPKNQIKTRNTIIQSEHEDDADAKRIVMVDSLGNFNSEDNPLFVQLTDGSITIGTVNAELEVQLSHLDNDPDAGDVHDSVRIGDGVKEITATEYGSSKNVIDTAPLGLSISRGKYPGFSTVNVYGRNLEIDVANEEEINPLGTTFIPATAAPINILSTSASDDSAGSGARELTIKGLDSNYDEIEEIITLDGISQVTTVASFLRVNSVEVTDVGGSGSNVGIIVGFHGLLEFLFTIQEEDNKHLSTFYTVPAGKTARLTSFFASVVPKQSAVGIKEGEIALHATNGSNGIFVRRFSLGLSSRATAPFTIEVHENFPEMTDIRVTFIANSNNSKVTAGYEIILEDNP